MKGKTVLKSLIIASLATLPIALVCLAVMIISVAVLVLNGISLYMIPVIIALVVSAVIFFALTADDAVLIVCLAVRFIYRLVKNNKK